MMKVLFLSAWFPYPADNGSKLRVYYLLRALQAGHEVTLVSLVFGSTRPEPPTSSSLTIYPIANNPFDRPKWLRLLRFLSFSPIVARPIAEMSQMVKQLLATNRFDLVIASTEIVAGYALWFAGPKMLEEHNSLSRLMGERYQKALSPLEKVSHWLSWQKTKWYERHLFNQFDQVLMVSEQDGQVSRQLVRDPGRITVISNGVDCVYNRPGLVTPLPNHLVFNGALTYQANYDAMAYFLGDIYPQIEATVPPVSLTITGSTEGVALHQLPAPAGLNFSGYLADIRPAVAQATVCVVPLREGGGTRLKILEAMALGTPVVATSKGAEGLAVESGRDILIADTPHDFAQAVIQLLTNPTLRQQLAHHGRQLVEEKYNWQHIGQQFLHLAENVVAQKQINHSR